MGISIIIYFQIYFHYCWIYFSFEVWCISLLCRKWLSKILDLQTLWFINQQRKLFKYSCEKKSYMQKLNSIKTYMKKRMTYNMLSLWFQKFQDNLKVHIQKNHVKIYIFLWNQFQKLPKIFMNSFEEALEGEMNMEESDYETCNICDFNSIRQ